MTLPSKKGREEMNDAGPAAMGDYIQRMANGRYILLRGRFKGGYLDTVPSGYIRNFLLKTCKEDMTPTETELCEKYAGDETKTYRRKLKMTTKTVVEVDGKGIAAAFAKAAEHGCAEISINIPVPPQMLREDDDGTIDQLRTRGTPIELIGSYLLADQSQDANAAYRTSILEALYERLRKLPAVSTETKFLTDKALHLQPDDTLCYDLNELKEMGEVMPLGLTPESVNTPIDGAPLFILDSGDHINLITDDVQTSVLYTLQNITEWYLDRCSKTMERVLHAQGMGTFTFIIVPNRSTTELSITEGKVHGRALLAILGYFRKAA